MTRQPEPLSHVQPIVLVVDDDRDNLRLLSGILSDHGYLARLSPNGAFALQSARSAAPDLVLLDIELPDLDGYTICEQLKSDPRTAAAPVIFLSARHGTFDIVRAFAAGAVDYITKPFATEEVLARVQVHLSVTQLQQQLQERVTELHHEISYRERAEQALSEREEQFRLTFEQSPIGVAMIALDYRFIRVNDTLCAITGYSREELLARDFQSITHPDDHDVDFVSVSQLASGEIDHYKIEKRYVHKHGATVWVTIHSRVVRDTSGKPLYYLGLIEDISTRKKAEAALKASQERYRRLFASSGDAIMLLDETGVVIEANAAAINVFGVPHNRLVGAHAGMLQALDGTSTTNLFQHYLVGGMDRGEFSFRRPDGQSRIVQFTAARIGPRMYQAILRDVSEQKAAAAELEQARIVAEAATRAKSDFVAHISHEIRTPMNSVVGLTTLLLTSPLTAAQRDDVETIQRSGSALITLIDDILDFSKIEAGKLALEYHPFALRECIEEALDLLAPLADAKQLMLRYSADPVVPNVVVGDQGRIRQILVNLLSNAVRFTERGEIVLTLVGTPSVAANGDMPTWNILIAVRDTGIGIPPAQRRQIFQPFTQATTLTTRRYGGTDLGLTISQHLAQQMGGQIRVESTRGVGSNFILELALVTANAAPPSYLSPMQPVLAQRRAVIIADSEEVGESLARQLADWRMLSVVFLDPHAATRWLRSNDAVDVILIARDDSVTADSALVQQLRVATRQPALPAIHWATVAERVEQRSHSSHENTALLPLPMCSGMLHTALMRLLRGDHSSVPRADPIDAGMGQRHPLRILLAEDNDTNRQVARRLLAKLGYQVDVAMNGFDVLEMLKRQQYDLVFMDIQMPDMSGTEATHYVRTFWPPERQPRIAAMTAYASAENRAWLLNIGMDDYIRKPISIEELVRVLGSVTPRPQQARQQAAPISGGALDLRLFSTFLASVSDGDAAADAAFVQSYLADMDTQIHDLRAARDAHAVARVTRIAHTLKGLSNQLGAMDLAIIWRRIEAADEQGNAEDATELLQQAEAEYQDVKRMLAQHVPASVTQTFT